MDILKKYTYEVLLIIWILICVGIIKAETNSIKTITTTYTVVDKLQPVGTKYGAEYVLILKDEDNKLTDKSVTASTHYGAQVGKTLTFEHQERNGWMFLLMTWWAFVGVFVVIVNPFKKEKN